MGIKYILILIISLSIIYYKYNDIYNSIENYTDFNSYKYINDNIGIKLTLPFKKNLKIGIDNVVTHQKIADILNYYGAYSIIKNDNISSVLNKVNNNTLDFAITQEDIVYNAVNGYSNYNNKKLENIRGICSVYFEYFLLIVNESINKESIENLKTGDKNYIFGTEFTDTSSDYYFIKLFESYNFKLIKVDDIKSYNEQKYLYKENTIYYVNKSKNKILNLFLKNKLDGIFILSNFSDISIRNLLKIKMVRFLPTSTEDNLNNNILRGLYNKKLNTSLFYESSVSDDNECDTDPKLGPVSMNSINWKLREMNPPICFSKEIIDVKASRVIFIANKNIDKKDAFNFSKLIFNLHKVMRNKVSQLNNTSYLGLGYADEFIPNKMSYIVKDIQLHKGAYNYLYELGYITNINHPKCIEFVGKSKCKIKSDNVNKYKYYWKYNKIGLNKYNLDKY